MNKKKELWLNIANYNFEHLVPTHLWDEIIAKFGGPNPSLIAFADKLSRKLKWDKKFTLKAIWEYKKFVFLGVISDFSVTPSKYIDQVWHEHLLFSAGYRKFCKDVIQYEFDHNPELVPLDAQTLTYQKQYLNTLELYFKEFGIEPPADIWDTTKFKKEKDNNANYDTISPDFTSSSFENDSLISMFPNVDSHHVAYGGGEFGGGGSEGSFDDSSSSDSSDSGSSCSSSCGGGCGGGGGD